MSEADLPFEQARNAEYLALLKKKLARPMEYGTSRNQTWTAPQQVAGRSYDEMHPLIGRVGLIEPDEQLGRSFYVGGRWIEHDDFTVISWAAPMAKLFFGNAGYCGDLSHDDVAVRRTFDCHVDDVRGLLDEWVRRVEPSPLTGAQLTIAAPAPSPAGGMIRRRLRRLTDAVAPSGQPEVEADSPAPEPDLPTVVPQQELAKSAPFPPQPSPPDATEEQAPAVAPPPPALVEAEPPASLAKGMRAIHAVMSRLRAPRRPQLTSVLATLQPDQYELVSSDPTCPLLVQGHPGTGKTIVAAYRAAFLVQPESGDERRKVMLIGPSAEYVVHVEGLLRQLGTGDRVVVTHLEALMAGALRLGKATPSSWSGGIGGEHDDVDAKARGLADRAARVLFESGALRTGTGAARANLQFVYDLVASNGTPDRPLSRTADQIEWMGKLPPFDKAFRLRRYLPLLAQCAVAIQGPPVADRFHHVVVDEAQDVSPIEWNVLEQFLREEGGWTLVGDMNQRRSDTSYGRWSDIADHLGLGDDDDPVVPHVIERGYRSTAPILRFADRLLPAAQRGSETLQQDGPPVLVERVTTPSRLWSSAISVANGLAARHRDGTTAIITVDPGALIQELGRLGWRRGADLSQWSKGERKLRVFVPEAARGLEFDAVVVIEPSAFPENLGRQGQLYTSLTRANRELAVVWHRPLPDALRKAARG